MTVHIYIYLSNTTIVNCLNSMGGTHFMECNSAAKDTVPLKCNLTVSTRNSILDSRSFRESRIEFRGSSFEFRFSRFENQVSRIEFRVWRHSKNFRGRSKRKQTLTAKKLFFLYEARLTYKSFNLLSVILSLSAEIICKCMSIDVSLSFTARHGLCEAVQFELCFHTCRLIKFLEKKCDSSPAKF